MDYDPLQEIQMPDLSDALADKIANEQEDLVDTETLDEGGESADTFDAGAIGDALQEIYPDIEVEDEEPAQIEPTFTPEEQANLAQQEQMRTDMYAKDPRTESGLNEDKGGWDSIMDNIDAVSAGINDYIIDEVLNFIK